MSIDKDDKLSEVKTTVDESISPYYTDVFTPWETKEQLVVWEEVAKPWVFKGVIDTATITTTTDNVYNFSVADPDWEILSIWITWNWVYQEKTFEIPNYWNSALAYAELETQLKAWLEPEYSIVYVSWTNFTIQRLDKQELTLSNPNLVRNIELTWTNEHTLTDITVDGVTVQINGATYTTDAAWITYLETQLSDTIYFMQANGNDLVIARKDWAIPAISVLNYDRYTYIARWATHELSYIYSCNDIEKDYKHYVEIDWISDEYTLTSGLTYTTTSITIPLLNTPLGNWSSWNCTHHWIKRVDMLYDLIPWTWYTKWAMYQWGTWGWGDVDQEKYWFPFYKNDYSAISITQYSTEINSDLTTYTQTWLVFRYNK